MNSKRSRVALASSLALASLFALSTVGCAPTRTEDLAVVPLYGMDGVDVIPDEYIVVMRDETPPDVADRVKQETIGLGGLIRHSFGSPSPGFALKISQAGLTSLRQSPDIRYIQTNRMTQATGIQTCPPSWGLDWIDQDLNEDPTNGVYSYDATGEDVDVYVLDSGLDKTLSEFGGRVKAGKCTVFTPQNGNATPECDPDPLLFAAPDDYAKWTDVDGHGTHLAGIVGGTTHGVAKGVSLFSVRVSSAAADPCEPPGGSIADLEAGLEWVIQHHNQNRRAVILVGVVAEVPFYVSTANWINAAVEDGIVIVASAGNKTKNACDFMPGGDWAKYKDPNDPNNLYNLLPDKNEAIAVGAFEENGTVAPYSNFGECVDIFAPGSSIRSSVTKSGGCLSAPPAVRSGTSQAAAFVAGVAANLYGQYTGSMAPYAAAAAKDVRYELLNGALPDRLNGVNNNSPNSALHSHVNTLLASLDGKPGAMDADGCVDGFQYVTNQQSNVCSAGAQCCTNGECGHGVFCAHGHCEPCGAEGEICCFDDNSASGQCADYLACNGAGVCECGKLGGPCCGDGFCGPDPTVACNNQTNVCVDCGLPEQPCCNGTDCGDNLACLSGTCAQCGDMGQPCCDGTDCGDNLACLSGTCTLCGTMGQPCCDGTDCGDNLACLSGTCALCGSMGQSCCDGTDCGDNLACLSGTCALCGDMGQPCCDGTDCGDNLACLSGTCTLCGDMGQPCCDGTDCGDNLACLSGTCTLCGDMGQPCCDGTQCGGNLTCQSGTCALCGGVGQPCCDGTQCGGNLTCQSGACTPPEGPALLQLVGPKRLRDHDPLGQTVESVNVMNNELAPSIARGVVLNIAIYEPTQNGFAIVWDKDGTQPTTPSITFRAGETRANLITTRIGASGSVNILLSNGEAELVVDLVGYFTPSGTMGFSPVMQKRIELDLIASGNGPGNPVFAVPVDLGIANSAAVITLTAKKPSAKGFLAVYPYGAEYHPEGPDKFSNLNYVVHQEVVGGQDVVVGQDVANQAWVQPKNGKIMIYSQTENFSAVKVLVDVIAAFDVSSKAGFVPLANPMPAFDSRSGDPKFENNKFMKLSFDDPGVPGTPVGLLYNLTLINPSNSCFASLYASGPWPGTSVVNITALAPPLESMVAAGGVGALGPKRSMILYNNQNDGGSSDMAMDVSGYFVNP